MEIFLHLVLVDDKLQTFAYKIIYQIFARELLPML